MKAVLIIHILDIHNIMYNFILHHNFEQHFAYYMYDKNKPDVDHN